MTFFLVRENIFISKIHNGYTGKHLKVISHFLIMFEQKYK